MQDSRILIVDDERVWREEQLREPLKDIAGSVILSAESRAKTLSLLRQDQIDLMILNIRLDYDHSGDKEFDLLIERWTEILNVARDNETSAVVVTSNSHGIEIHELMRDAFRTHKVKDFIIKEEFDRDTYLEDIQRALLERGEERKPEPTYVPRQVKDFQRALLERGEERKPEPTFIPRQRMKISDRTALSNILAMYPLWDRRDGRKATLVRAGFPSNLVESLGNRLQEEPRSAASLVVYDLDGKGFLREPTDFTPLGLLAQYLVEELEDVEVGNFLRHLLDKYNWRKKPN